VLGAIAILLEPSARLIRPRAGRGVAKIEQPLFTSESALATLFVSQRQVEMHVGMRRHCTCRTTEMLDGFVNLAKFF
jgi:hypothetical protein